MRPMRKWLGIAILFATGPALGAPPRGENLSGRRAIRGEHIEAAHEGKELGELREFEKESFPSHQLIIP